MSKKNEIGYVITDPAMAPFYIRRNGDGGFIIMESIKSEKKDYERNVSYPSTLQNALRTVVDLKLLNKRAGHTYGSLKEYIEEWKELQDELKKVVL